MFMAEAGIKAGNDLVVEILQMKQENGKKMSKYKLAKDIRVSDTTVQKWYTGEASPSLPHFNKLQEEKTYLERVQRIPKPFGRD